MTSAHLIHASDIEAMEETEFVHPLNPNAVRMTKTLGTLSGLKNLGVHLVRVEPGKDTTEYHVHQDEDEFVYILSGTGVAEIGGETISVGKGDFLGFAAGGSPHTMHNPGPDDLVYLMAGEHRQEDTVDYPRKRIRLLKSGTNRDYIDL
jgi:uncharacterized cupin superfamily protein